MHGDRVVHSLAQLVDRNPEATTDLLTPALASFTLTFEDDTTPGLTSKTVETISYDLGTGQQLAFEDVFSDSQVALSALSAQAPPLLQTQLGAQYDPMAVLGGTSASLSNYRGWSLTPAGLRVTFGEAQVADAQAGLPSIVVPWSALESALVTDGPVAHLAGLY